MEIVLRRGRLAELLILLSFSQISFIGPVAEALSSDAHTWITKSFLISDLTNLLKTLLSCLQFVYQIL